MAARIKRAEPMMVEQLRDAIRSDGRRFVAIAAAAGIDSSRISRFLSGERDLTFTAVARVCEVIGAKLIFEAGDSPAPRKRAKAPPAKSARKPKTK
jgi:DNA-binding phage protein